MGEAATRGGACLALCLAFSGALAFFFGAHAMVGPGDLALALFRSSGVASVLALASALVLRALRALALPTEAALAACLTAVPPPPPPPLPPRGLLEAGPAAVRGNSVPRPRGPSMAPPPPPPLPSSRSRSREAALAMMRSLLRSRSALGVRSSERTEEGAGGASSSSSSSAVPTPVAAANLLLLGAAADRGSKPAESPLPLPLPLPPPLPPPAPPPPRPIMAGMGCSRNRRL